jgi:hypothetical protein
MGFFEAVDGPDNAPAGLRVRTLLGLEGLQLDHDMLELKAGFLAPLLLNPGP